MVTKEEIDAFVDFCRGADDIRVTSATWGRVVPALADENDRLAELVMKAAKDKVEYEDENDRLRAQLAEAERRGREDMRQSFLDVLRAWSSEDGGVFTESRAPSLYERLMSLTKEPTAPPPSDQDVRAALVEVLGKHAIYVDQNGEVVHTILADPLLGKLLRGGR